MPTVRGGVRVWDGRTESVVWGGRTRGPEAVGEQLFVGGSRRGPRPPRASDRPSSSSRRSQLEAATPAVRRRRRSLPLDRTLEWLAWSDNTALEGDRLEERWADPEVGSPGAWRPRRAGCFSARLGQKVQRRTSGAASPRRFCQVGDVGRSRGRNPSPRAAGNIPRNPSPGVPRRPPLPLGCTSRASRASPRCALWLHLAGTGSKTQAVGTRLVDHVVQQAQRVLPGCALTVIERPVDRVVGFVGIAQRDPVPLRNGGDLVGVQARLTGELSRRRGGHSRHLLSASASKSAIASRIACSSLIASSACVSQ